MNYEEDIKIDPSALDVEWLEQPSLFMQYARNSAQKRKELDIAKENLDVVRAEMDQKVRDNPEKYGVEKVTEAAVSAAIIKTQKYREALQEFNDARYEADIAQAAVSGMNQRKDALENLVKLHGMNYFAGPKMPRDLSYESKVKFDQKKANSTVATKLSRTRNN